MPRPDSPPTRPWLSVPSGPRGEIERVLVVGAGKAGGRFLRALEHLRLQGAPLQVSGVCDIAASQLAPLAGSYETFTDLDEACARTRPTVVCVCANEVAHRDVLATVAGLEDVPLVLSEKPLTAALAEFDEIAGMLPAEGVTVNFVERHSPVVEDFLDWRAESGATIYRCEFFWGKYRWRDGRPTMGVLSEMSHPLDLVRCLCDLDADVPAEVLDASLASSDFSADDVVVPDSADVHLVLGGSIVVRGHSSFLWDSRMRRIVIYAGASDGETFRAVLEFDDSRWDQDRLVVARLDPVGGRPETVLRTAYDNDDFPAALDQVHKVARFVDESLALRVAGARPGRLVTMAGAGWIQRVLDAIEHHDVRGKSARPTHDDPRGVGELVGAGLDV